MKALSTTILIVVTAVVILVAALVLLTIFGKTLVPITDLSQAKSICIQEAGASCTITHSLPSTWFAPRFTDAQGKSVACSSAAPGCNCGTDEKGNSILIGCS